jgi:hypothetical protein
MFTGPLSHAQVRGAVQGFWGTYLGTGEVIFLEKKEGRVHVRGLKGTVSDPLDNPKIVWETKRTGFGVLPPNLEGGRVVGLAHTKAFLFAVEKGQEIFILKHSHSAHDRGRNEELEIVERFEHPLPAQYGLQLVGFSPTTKRTWGVTPRGELWERKADGTFAAAQRPEAFSRIPKVGILSAADFGDAQPVLLVKSGKQFFVVDSRWDFKIPKIKGCRDWLEND